MDEIEAEMAIVDRTLSLIEKRRLAEEKRKAEQEEKSWPPKLETKIVEVEKK